MLEGSAHLSPLLCDEVLSPAPSPGSHDFPQTSPEHVPELNVDSTDNGSSPEPSHVPTTTKAKTVNAFDTSLNSTSRAEIISDTTSNSVPANTISDKQNLHPPTQFKTYADFSNHIYASMDHSTSIETQDLSKPVVYPPPVLPLPKNALAVEPHTEDQPK